MALLLELISYGPPNPESARSLTFPCSCLNTQAPSSSESWLSILCQPTLHALRIAEFFRKETTALEVYLPFLVVRNLLAPAVYRWIYLSYGSAEFSNRQFHDFLLPSLELTSMQPVCRLAEHILQCSMKFLVRFQNFYEKWVTVL